MVVAAGPVGRFRRFNQKAKSRAGWLVLAAVVLVALVAGATRSAGPLTDDDRVDAIAKRLACPVCDGESVFESQSSSAIGIRAQIKRLVQTGGYSDDAIIDYIEATPSGAQTQLVPKGTGFEAVVWALPVVVLVCAAAGLTIAFRRWKRAADVVPTEADRELVAAAMRAEVDDA